MRAFLFYDMTIKFYDPKDGERYVEFMPNYKDGGVIIWHSHNSIEPPSSIELDASDLEDLCTNLNKIKKQLEEFHGR